MKKAKLRVELSTLTNVHFLLFTAIYKKRGTFNNLGYIGLYPEVSYNFIKTTQDHHTYAYVLDITYNLYDKTEQLVTTEKCISNGVVYSEHVLGFVSKMSEYQTGNKDSNKLVNLKRLTDLLDLRLKRLRMQ